MTSLVLGSETYAQTELLAILGTPVRGDASLILAKQLIAAKLNIESGSDPAPAGAAIADADGLLGGFPGKLPYGVKTDTPAGQAMTAAAAVLDDYNNQALTPGCTPPPIESGGGGKELRPAARTSGPIPAGPSSFHR